MVANRPQKSDKAPLLGTIFNAAALLVHHNRPYFQHKENTLTELKREAYLGVTSIISQTKPSCLILFYLTILRNPSEFFAPVAQASNPTYPCTHELRWPVHLVPPTKNAHKTSNVMTIFRAFGIFFVLIPLNTVEDECLPPRRGIRVRAVESLVCSICQSDAHVDGIQRPRRPKILHNVRRSSSTKKNIRAILIII